MSNYQRLISYMYAYEGGIKGKNIGFAKLETKGGQCRISVSLKRIPIAGNPKGVYLLSDNTELRIGTLLLRNGTGEFRTAVNISDVEGSGYSLKQCYGLTIHETESAWRCYTTIWEDAVAHAAELESEKAFSESEEQKAESQQEEVQQEEAEQTETQQTETQPIEMEQTAEQQEELQVEVEQKEVPQIEAEQEEEQKAEEAQIEAPELEENEIWKSYCRRYPKILAFDTEDGCEILTIQPQDIGLLPRENWTLGSNSFLLHGYYYYRYLILARLNQKNGESRYLLGVPGYYVSNEKYMAAMFGFSGFVLSKKQPSKSSRFGYWYRDIKIR